MPVKTKNADWADVPSVYSGMDFSDEDMDWNISFIDLPVSEFLTGAEELEYNSPLTEQTLTTKYQIRHHDCMWSGRCGSHPEKSKCNQKHSNINHNNNNQPQQTKATNLSTATAPLTHLTAVPPTQICQMKQQIQQQIPAGRSLLRQNQLKPIRMPVIQQTDFLREREIIARPDTPLSLDDDPPEFKHRIDLAACTVGSNNMSLISDETDSATIINKIKESLEDSSTPNNIDIVQQIKLEPESLSDILKDMKYLSDFEEMDDDGDRDSAVDMDSDSESGGNTTTESSMSSQSTAYEYQATHVGDHSYTRCKNRVDTVGLGVQTPSDSEEEIDVVSVGDKTLPTNPSARDRRALQTTVAHKISARMVKPVRQSGGLKTLPPRRRCSEDSILASSCSSTPTKVSNSPSYDMHMMSSSASSISSSSRKRSKQSNGESGSSKRHRGKKQRSPGKRQHSDSDEADTIEKRNLHNDMERQRRIGLKNLFEELKYQIPSIRDKERAPKVSILREAASLCNKLNREQEQMTALKKQQQRLLARVKTLRTSLAHQWG